MIIALWIVNALLALAFIAAGFMKAVRPKEQLAAAGMAWTDDYAAGSVKAIGLLEVVGGLGLILPLATGILPILAPLAAVGLAIVMAGAVVVHVRRSESFAPSLVLGVLSIVSAVLGFVALV
ncbi:DoxX family protein [Microbacterium fluvii]|uniref:DoxX family protein n=1 Tax=Microbacterium fluvii TaxID=415215 RepID=A0ABW2H9K7_9MICO|nr:DoxX family protein [Microbacterium fluvii]MCU4671657.1 DoxX family protein [Microbacterium fluvii]